MCACGCFVIAAVVAGIAYCVIHALWLPATLILLVTLALGWLARKGMGVWR